MPRPKIILNPYAGRKKAGHLRARIEQAFRQTGIPFDLAETAGAGHAIELARQAKEAGATPIIAAGGDGTVSEVVNGLAQATPPGELVGPIGVLAVGSANDFAAMAGCPLDIATAVQAIVAGHTRQVDLGCATLKTGATTLRRYFDNNVGIGFEAWVTLESYKIRWLRGAPLYILAALRALRQCPAPLVQIAWEAANGEVHQRTQQTLMISVGNSPRTGGGFFLTPEARLDDGLLDIGIAGAVSRLRILRLLPKALRGQHTSDPAFTLVRSRKLAVDMADPLPVHLDGEVVMQNAEHITIAVLPGRLAVIV
jgi:YegS/Rv2252/BmrU family lipid kinase